MKGSGRDAAAMGAIARMLLGIMAAALPLGCGNGTKPAAAGTVRGRLTFQNQPVAGGTIVFTPDRDRGSSGPPIRTDTGPGGAFTLMRDGGPAIPPGWYRVAIAPPPGDTHAGANEAFPTQLCRPDQSTLVRQVEAGKDHFFEFAVSVPPQ